MASMRDIRIRIKSIKDTMQITKAMNLIASSKLQKARRQLNHTLPYFEKIQSTLKDILAHSPDIEHVFFDKRENVHPKKVGYIVITADKGMCGAYNHNVIKLAEEHMKDKEDKFLFVIGHHGRDYFRKKGYNIDIEFLYTAQNPTTYRAREIGESLISMYRHNMLDEIYIVYTNMESGVKQEPRVMKLLPLEKSHFNVVTDPGEQYKEYVVYDPSPKAVLDSIVPNYIKGLIFGALVESFCSEQSARMAAMDAATKNAKEMIRELTLLYNRARQAAITQEIAEIAGGAEALR
ncbi:MAG: F-type H+-transporting ATPase subunit gamma [Clostridiales bacterium]|nr:F-type H+-transporting ATPase subunit gamma [Clostridiales bacterium]MDK2934759.1 F-type H+-transporting ATPase subunit gamma [Clostridiales bacterium]